MLWKVRGDWEVEPIGYDWLSLFVSLMMSELLVKEGRG